MAKINTPEAANRLARAIASDLALYNKEKIVKGLQEDNLFESLADEIKEGRDLFNERVDESLRARTNFFERAIVDVLIKPNANIQTSIW
ncbi:MAG: hypothetical protein GMKNLPBB_00623 [Myxococcota bacterium]|nr:hypothetical protein [Myxococcota bacterium]